MLQTCFSTSQQFWIKMLKYKFMFNNSKEKTWSSVSTTVEKKWLISQRCGAAVSVSWPCSITVPVQKWHHSHNNHRHGQRRNQAMDLQTPSKCQLSLLSARSAEENWSENCRTSLYFSLTASSSPSRDRSIVHSWKLARCCYVYCLDHWYWTPWRLLVFTQSLNVGSKQSVTMISKVCEVGERRWSLLFLTDSEMLVSTKPRGPCQIAGEKTWLTVNGIRWSSDVATVKMTCRCHCIQTFRWENLRWSRCCVSCIQCQSRSAGQ